MQTLSYTELRSWLHVQVLRATDAYTIRVLLSLTEAVNTSEACRCRDKLNPKGPNRGAF